MLNVCAMFDAGLLTSVCKLPLYYLWDDLDVFHAIVLAYLKYQDDYLQ